MIKKTLSQDFGNIKNNILSPSQHGLIKRALQIISDQLFCIDQLTKRADQVEGEILSIKSRYLKVFHEISEFLLGETKAESFRDNGKFYIPNIRTLLDIYSRLLYLANQEQDKQFVACVYDRLATLKNIESQELFDQHYLIYQPLFAKFSGELPEFHEFPKHRLDLKGKYKNYFFPSSKVMISGRNIKKFKPLIQKDGEKMVDTLNKNYWHFSAYVHGNPLTSGAIGREYLWITVNLLFLLSYMVVLVDIDITNMEFNKRIKIWEENFLRELPELERKYAEERAKK